MRLRKFHGSLLVLGILLATALNSLSAGSQLLDITPSGQKTIRKFRGNPVIRWRINPANAPAGAKELIAAAFQTWVDQSQAQITVEFAGETNQAGPKLDGYSDIYFNVSLSSLGIGSSVIAITLLNSELPTTLSSESAAETKEADILFNPTLVSQLVTSTPSSSTDLDLQEIVTHEIGHLLGLAHSFLVDSMMFPAKPDPNRTPVELQNLFRVPKRTLSQDDIAWISSIYPKSSFQQSLAAIDGQVTYGGRAYVGAEVVALKINEPDLNLLYYPASQPTTLIVKGIKNVSAFSEENGNFSIKGLLPGDYRLISHNTGSFLNYTLANINNYLASFSSDEFFPTQFWMNPECASGSTVTSLNIGSLYGDTSTTSTFSLSAGEGLCGIEVKAKLNGTSSCTGVRQVGGFCSGGGGGCSLDTSVLDEAHDHFNLRDHPGLVLGILGGLILYLTARRQAYKMNKDIKKKKLDKKPPSERSWL